MDFIEIFLKNLDYKKYNIYFLNLFFRIIIIKTTS
jgi:hypothetical protein